MGALGNYRMRFDPDDGTCEFEGADKPSGTRVVCETSDVAEGEGPLVAVKVPGHHYYSGQGQPQAYAPAAFEVYEIWDFEGREHGYPVAAALWEYDGRWLDVRFVMRWDIRS